MNAIGFIALCVGLSVGTIYGHCLVHRALLSGADNPERTPHKLGDGFYYIMPEHEYCEMMSRWVH